MISVGFKTDKGLSRGNNEDSIFALPGSNIFLVADGVGGQNSGQIASRTAVGFMAQYVKEHPIEDIPAGTALTKYFRELFTETNDLVFKQSCVMNENYGMATTALLCYVRDNSAYLVNVGDSRAYLVRNNRIHQLTRDHTRVQELLDSGAIAPSDVETHKDKHKITRAVGGGPVIRPEYFTLDLFAGDTLILCTDGLYGMVAEDEIAEVAGRAKTMHGLAKSLVDMANAGGGEDNVSVVCIRVQ